MSSRAAGLARLKRRIDLLIDQKSRGVHSNEEFKKLRLLTTKEEHDAWPKEMPHDIAGIQADIMALGWQWEERVFNDGRIGNCMIHFTQDTSTQAFTPEHELLGDVGWGRFDQHTAWRMAWEYIICGITHL